MQKFKLKSGSEKIDNLLQGGFISGDIIECHGEFGSGKTQLAFQLLVNSQLPKEKGGIDGNCIFLDTENTFRKERVEQIAKEKGLEIEKILEKTKIVRVKNTKHQLLAIEEIEKILEKTPVKLIILDSMTNLFRKEYSGENIKDRQEKLGGIIIRLLRLADVYNIIVFVTNQVYTDINKLVGDPIKAVGGNVLNHIKFRLYLKKYANGMRVIKLLDSPFMQDENSATFKITEGGIK